MVDAKTFVILRASLAQNPGSLQRGDSEIKDAVSEDP